MINPFKKKDDKKEYNALYINKLVYRPIIKDLSFKVKKGDIYGIVGMSGSGKTTCLNLIAGLLSKQSGEIKIFGTELNKKIIGYCTQSNSFFTEFTIRENLIVFGSLNGISIDESLKRGNDLMKELHLKEDIDRLSGQLSGGQQQRLNIILSVIHNPKLLLMDEPFAALDYYNRRLLWKFLMKIKRKGVTVIVTTHLLNEAEKFCNQLLIIDKGERFATGSISDLKRKLKFYSYLRIHFSYLNKANMEKIKDYCKNNDIKILELFENDISFSLPDEKFYDKMTKLFDKLNIKHNVAEFRDPTLNDLFMVTLKNEVE